MTSSTSPDAKKSPPRAVAFIEDDYPRALAEAKARKVPLFVDAWAPWCHSCLSMREYTFTDASLAPLGKDFVFLAIDTEKESNAAFVTRFPNQVWPTLYVIDPDAERADVKWGGTATARELTLLLAIASGANGDKGAPYLTAFVAGNKASAKGDLATAESSYRAALSMAPESWSERARVIEALASTLSEEEKWADCVALADAEVPKMARGSSRATVLATTVSCADERKLGADNTRPLHALVRAEIVASGNDDGTLLADDRSSLYDTLVSEEEKDPATKDAAKADAEEWARFLEREASRAKTNEARAVFDPHRLLAYTAAGRENDAIPMLERSLKDFPSDYNPKARLAKVYFDAKDLPRARSYVDAAFKEVYGPRTLRVAALGATIAKAQNQPEAARAFLTQGIDRVKNLPLTKRQQKQLQSAQADLAKL